MGLRPAAAREERGNRGLGEAKIGTSPVSPGEDDAGALVCFTPFIILVRLVTFGCAYLCRGRGPVSLLIVMYPHETTFKLIKTPFETIFFLSDGLQLFSFSSHKGALLEELPAR